MNLRSMDDVLATFPKLNWKKDVDADGNGTAYAVVGGDKQTGCLWVFAVIQKATAPRHRHERGAEFGEKIGTFAGELYDRDDSGRSVCLGPADVLYHEPGSVHQPHADFWFGYYHQPRGSTILTDPHEEPHLA